jgi:preprotein translocase subunit SecA
LRAKGIDNQSPELTYTGPAEDGSAQVQGNGGKTPAGVGGTRRERREAARRQGRHTKPKSAKRR